MTAPVLVQAAGRRVSICVLANTPDGIAIVAKNTYRPIGQVEKSARKGEHGFIVTVWEWRDEKGSTGVGSTKTEAISKMLKANGFHEVPVEATMPDLLAGLDETENTNP